MKSSRGVVWALAVAAVAAQSCQSLLEIEEIRYSPDARQQCAIRSDCADEERCFFGICSVECRKDSDCAKGLRCLNTADGAACVTAAQADCESARCPDGTSCAGDECRSDCTPEAVECLVGQACRGSVCVGLDPERDPTANNVPGAEAGQGGDGGRSGGAGKGGTGGGVGTGGSGASSTTGGVTNGAGGNTPEAGDGSGGHSATAGAANDAGEGGQPIVNGGAGDGGESGSGGTVSGGGTGGTGGACQLGTREHCGQCNRVCENNHANNVCVSGECTPTCSSTYYDCDEITTNGCESRCVFANATAGCISDTCGMLGCNTGWGNCNDSSTDGCECERIKLETSFTGSNASGLAGITTQFTLKRAFGAGRLLVLLVAARGTSTSGATPFTSFENQTRVFTLGHSVFAGSTGQAWAGVFYMNDANLPAAAGTYALRVYESQNELIVNALEFSNVNQTNPLDVIGGSTGGNCTMDDPSDAIQVRSESWLLSGAALRFGEGSPLSGQTETADLAAGELRLLAGYLPNSTSGTKTVAWNASACSASAHVLVALRPRPP